MSDTAAGSNTPSADDPAPGSGDPVAVGTKGGGEWPSKDAPPTGAAPGSDPTRAAELREQRKEHTTSGDGTAAGELHPQTRLASPYEQQPDAAAVGSTPPDDRGRAPGGPLYQPESEGEEPPARDAGAARDRGPAPIGKPRTEQT
jgi:hypothetical protein